MEVSQSWGTPSSHPFIDGIFLHKPTSYWGTSIYGNPPSPFRRFWLFWPIVCSPPVSIPSPKNDTSRFSSSKPLLRGCLFYAQNGCSKHPCEMLVNYTFNSATTNVQNPKNWSFSGGGRNSHNGWWSSSKYLLLWCHVSTNKGFEQCWYIYIYIYIYICIYICKYIYIYISVVSNNMTVKVPWLIMLFPMVRWQCLATPHFIWLDKPNSRHSNDGSAWNSKNTTQPWVLNNQALVLSQSIYTSIYKLHPYPLTISYFRSKTIIPHEHKQVHVEIVISHLILPHSNHINP